MPMSLAMSIPLEYAYALTRAQTDVAYRDLPRANWRPIIERFGDILKASDPLFKERLLIVRTGGKTVRVSVSEGTVTSSSAAR